MYKDVFGREHKYGPPVGWTPTFGTTRFDADESWAAIMEHGLSFPEYEGPTYFTQIQGDCLTPLITEQHTARCRRLAEDEPLIDGGLYVVAWENESQIRDFCAQHGIERKEGEPFLIAKFLRHIGYEWWVQANDCIWRLNGTVVAQVVGLSSCPEAHALSGKIASNAATSLATASASAVSVGTSNIGNTTAIVSVTVGPFPFSTTAIVTATGTWTADATHPTTAVNFSIATAVNSLPNNIQVTPIVASQQGVIAAEQTFSLAADTTQTYYLNGVSLPGSAPLNLYAATATLKVEVIKK